MKVQRHEEYVCWVLAIGLFRWYYYSICVILIFCITTHCPLAVRCRRAALSHHPHLQALLHVGLPWRWDAAETRKSCPSTRLGVMPSLRFSKETTAREEGIALPLPEESGASRTSSPLSITSGSEDILVC